MEISMFSFLLIMALTVSASVLYCITKKKMMARIQTLEQDLQLFSDVVSQMTEVQKKMYQKFTVGFEHLEERIMELSVPSHDSNLPLERRHRVLTLARQGVALEEIVKRLKAPIGEAELILNLQKYMGGEATRPVKGNEQVNPYV
jgi:hypothetical protein